MNHSYRLNGSHTYQLENDKWLQESREREEKEQREERETHVQLVRNLMELFYQIDVNDDKLLEWTEFTNHIIELGMVRKDRIFIDAIKNYNLSPI